MVCAKIGPIRLVPHRGEIGLVPHIVPIDPSELVSLVGLLNGKILVLLAGHDVVRGNVRTIFLRPNGRKAWCSIDFVTAYSLKAKASVSGFCVVTT